MFNNAKELQSAINELDRKFYLNNRFPVKIVKPKSNRKHSKIIKNKNYE